MNEVKDELSLGVSVVCERAEVVGKDLEYRESFDYSIARAVAQINTLSEYALPLTKVGGKVVLWKGETYREELDAAKNALSILGGKVSEVLSYDLDKFGKRYLVVIEKVKETPAKYPRGLGKERKCPL